MGEPTRAEKLFRQVLSSFAQFSSDPGQRFHAYVDFSMLVSLDFKLSLSQASIFFLQCQCFV